ncbi:single-stranded DNA-binding protein [Limosilactobacillus agrestimuris]|uniref:single-stranded DNA-binding protein n=1 Tax=Limosilactobacillus agrestimuris TaxID=2941331 RepID=UPI00203B03DF|nr:single-stranded DNA-binding protein [Limosilactobacillus agrestimuris]
MINRAVLTGRITKDPELRYTQSGTAVVQFTLAVDRQFKNQNGEREADFIDCVIWRKSAENFANFTHKGSKIGVDGRIQTRSYENQQGNRVFVTEIIVDSFALLDSRQDSQQGYAPQSQNNQAQGKFNGNQGNYQQQGNNGSQGYQSQNNNGYQNNQQQYDNGQSVNIDDSELPF